jgi:hypothetical protein
MKTRLSLPGPFLRYVADHQAKYSDTGQQCDLLKLYHSKLVEWGGKSALWAPPFLDIRVSPKNQCPCHEIGLYAVRETGWERIGQHSDGYKQPDIVIGSSRMCPKWYLDIKSGPKSIRKSEMYPQCVIVHGTIIRQDESGLEFNFKFLEASVILSRMTDAGDKWKPQSDCLSCRGLGKPCGDMHGWTSVDNVGPWKEDCREWET